MTNPMINTTVEILGKDYPIRCPEDQVPALQQAAEYLHKKMLEVQESGKAINLERIAIITALNIAYEFLQNDHQKSSTMTKINERLFHLQEKLDSAINNALETEPSYSAK